MQNNKSIAVKKTKYWEDRLEIKPTYMNSKGPSDSLVSLTFNKVVFLQETTCKLKS